MMEKISWTDRVKKNEDALQRGREKKEHPTYDTTKANWTGHLLRRNCLLKRVTEGKIRGDGRTRQKA